MLVPPAVAEPLLVRPLDDPMLSHLAQPPLREGKMKMKTNILFASVVLSTGLLPASAGQPDPRFDGVWVGVENTRTDASMIMKGETINRPAQIVIADSGRALGVIRGLSPGRYVVSLQKSGGNVLVFSPRRWPLLGEINLVRRRKYIDRGGNGFGHGTVRSARRSNLARPWGHQGARRFTHHRNVSSRSKEVKEGAAQSYKRQQSSDDRQGITCRMEYGVQTA